MTEVAEGSGWCGCCPTCSAIDKEFDYLVPDGVAVQVGDVVRIQLGARRVGGWIVAVDVEPVPGVRLAAGQGERPGAAPRN